MLALLFGLAFTGTVLRADQEAVEALAHAVAGAQFAGPLGAPFQPGFTPSSPLLARMYGLHISVLPIALVLLLALHLWLVRHLGVSAGGEPRAPFHNHLLPLGGFALLLVAVVSTVALASPADLLAPGVDGFEVTKPFWPFLWIYAAENLAVWDAGYAAGAGGAVRVSRTRSGHRQTGRLASDDNAGDRRIPAGADAGGDTLCGAGTRPGASQHVEAGG